MKRFLFFLSILLCSSVSGYVLAYSPNAQDEVLVDQLVERIDVLVGERDVAFGERLARALDGYRDRHAHNDRMMYLLTALIAHLDSDADTLDQEEMQRVWKLYSNDFSVYTVEASADRLVHRIERVNNPLATREVTQTRQEPRDFYNERVSSWRDDTVPFLEMYPNGGVIACDQNMLGFRSYQGQCYRELALMEYNEFFFLQHDDVYVYITVGFLHSGPGALCVGDSNGEEWDDCIQDIRDANWTAPFAFIGF